ncbi:MAG: DUF805 domain-containing protein [Oryzihumus sp.]|jgi:uncharacterized membrane protein YhaH (DUF805 family)
MSFTDAIRSGFAKYVTFSGRARRSEYWFWALFAFIVGAVANVISNAAHTQIISYVVSLALFLPGLAVAVRRLHDTSRTGWWVLIAIVPIVGAIVLIVFLAQDSVPGDNAWGPNPKGLQAVPQAPGAPYGA